MQGAGARGADRGNWERGGPIDAAGSWNHPIPRSLPSVLPAQMNFPHNGDKKHAALKPLVVRHALRDTKASDTPVAAAAAAAAALEPTPLMRGRMTRDAEGNVDFKGLWSFEEADMRDTATSSPFEYVCVGGGWGGTPPHRRSTAANRCRPHHSTPPTLQATGSWRPWAARRRSPSRGAIWASTASGSPAGACVEGEGLQTIPNPWYYYTHPIPPVT